MQILTRSTQIRMVQVLLLISLVSWNVAAQSAPPRKAPPRKDIPAIAKAANGSVVSIVMSDKDGKPIVQGSGFFVSKDGLIVTNYHVIAEGSSAVVKLPDGAFYVVKGVLTFDKTRDIAIIKVNDPFADAIPASPHDQNFNFLTLTLGNSDRVQIGEEVVAIGNPLSLESTVSNGIISGIRTVEKLGGRFLQITSPISPGSSGGPLFNMMGEVIGITTMNLKGGENLNFAIPINDAKHLIASLEEPGVEVLDFPNEKESAAKSNKDTFHIMSYEPNANIVVVRHHNKLFTAIPNASICQLGGGCKHVPSIAGELVGEDVVNLMACHDNNNNFAGCEDVDGYPLAEYYTDQHLDLIEHPKGMEHKEPSGGRVEEWRVTHIEEIKP